MEWHFRLKREEAVIVFQTFSIANALEDFHSPACIQVDLKCQPA
jgi:hypothetical protein